MQAVVLAAGVGRRLGALTERSTKCMLEVDGRRLIEHTLDALVAADIERIVLVVGHGADEVRSLVGAHHQGTPVRYVHNPRYAQTNTSVSLLLAREHLETDDTLVLEGDLVLDSGIIAECARIDAPNVAVVAGLQPGMDGVVAVLDDRDHVSRFVRHGEIDWASADRCRKTVNLYRLAGTFSRERFGPFLETFVANGGGTRYYEDALDGLLRQRAAEIVALPVGDQYWQEIDEVADLESARAAFAGRRLVQARRS